MKETVIHMMNAMTTTFVDQTTVQTHLILPSIVIVAIMQVIYQMDVCTLPLNFNKKLLVVFLQYLQSHGKSMFI